MSPRVWIGKDDAPCRLVVDCPNCERPAEVRDPDAGESADRVVACLVHCKRVVTCDVSEALKYWNHHKERCHHA